jgi:hypothetical protein
MPSPEGWGVVFSQASDCVADRSQRADNARFHKLPLTANRCNGTIGTYCYHHQSTPLIRYYLQARFSAKPIRPCASSRHHACQAQPAVGRHRTLPILPPSRPTPRCTQGRISLSGGRKGREGARPPHKLRPQELEAVVRSPLAGPHRSKPFIRRQPLTNSEFAALPPFWAWPIRRRQPRHYQQRSHPRCLSL